LLLETEPAETVIWPLFLYGNSNWRIVHAWMICMCSSWLAMHKSLKLRIINCISLKKIYMDICERFYTVRSIDKEIYLNILCVIFLVWKYIKIIFFLIFKI
jgi:hypothetical protein